MYSSFGSSKCTYGSEYSFTDPLAGDKSPFESSVRKLIMGESGESLSTSTYCRPPDPLLSGSGSTQRHLHDILRNPKEAWIRDQLRLTNEWMAEKETEKSFREMQRNAEYVSNFTRRINDGRPQNITNFTMQPAPNQLFTRNGSSLSGVTVFEEPSIWNFNIVPRRGNEYSKENLWADLNIQLNTPLGHESGSWAQVNRNSVIDLHADTLFTCMSKSLKYKHRSGFSLSGETYNIPSTDGKARTVSIECDDTLLSRTRFELQLSEFHNHKLGEPGPHCIRCTTDRYGLDGIRGLAERLWNSDAKTQVGGSYTMGVREFFINHQQEFKYGQVTFNIRHTKRQGSDGNGWSSSISGFLNWLTL